MSFAYFLLQKRKIRFLMSHSWRLFYVWRSSPWRLDVRIELVSIFIVSFFLLSPEHFSATSRAAAARCVWTRKTHAVATFLIFHSRKKKIDSRLFEEKNTNLRDGRKRVLLSRFEEAEIIVCEITCPRCAACWPMAMVFLDRWESTH